MHRLHSGLVSSHFTRRMLKRSFWSDSWNSVAPDVWSIGQVYRGVTNRQVMHPVVTLGAHFLFLWESGTMAGFLAPSLPILYPVLVSCSRSLNMICVTESTSVHAMSRFSQNKCRYRRCVIKYPAKLVIVIPLNSAEYK